MSQATCGAVARLDGILPGSARRRPTCERELSTATEREKAPTPGSSTGGQAGARKPGQALRVAVVGAGFIADIHMESYERFVPEAEIVAVYTRDARKAEAFAKRHHIPKSFSELERTIRESSGIDRPVQQQLSAAERVVSADAVHNDVPGFKRVQKLLGFLEPAESRLGFAELRRNPGPRRGSDRQREHGVGRRLGDDLSRAQVLQGS